MKQLNNSGADIVEMVKNDLYLKDKNIRIWTGDTLTAASVYNQIISIPNATKIFYIGANGKIGNAVCHMLVKKNIQILVYSKAELYNHPNITYTQNINDMANYKYIIIGKLLKSSIYENALNGSSITGTHYLLDYTVPFLPLKLKGKECYEHIQIGLLKVTNNAFLKGHFDVCMGTEENHIYPCHAGCILNMLDKRETDEVGDINLAEMDSLWAKANENGLINRTISLI